MNAIAAFTLSTGHDCEDCYHEAETVRASYELVYAWGERVYVCDTHLDIRHEDAAEYVEPPTTVA
jgi:hypothetical protein